MFTQNNAMTSECGLQHMFTQNNAVTSECGLQHMFTQNNGRGSKSSGVFCSVVGLVVPDVFKDPSGLQNIWIYSPSSIAQHPIGL